jgi:hypothetical protein
MSRARRRARRDRIALIQSALSGFVSGATRAALSWLLDQM